MELLLLLVVGGGAFLFLRNNARNGAEIMRAHVYLIALMHGKTQAEANAFVAGDMTETPPQVAGLATSHIHASYGGKSLAMVADAYTKGMRPKLPNWQQGLIATKYRTEADGPYRKQSDGFAAQAGSGPAPAAPTVSMPGHPGTTATKGHSRTEAASDEYVRYYQAYLLELKRLAGKQPHEAHPAELMLEIDQLMGDDVTEQAFREGMPPEQLAAIMHRNLLPHFPELGTGQVGRT